MQRGGASQILAAPKFFLAVKFYSTNRNYNKWGGAKSRGKEARPVE